ncbi:MAG: hypothetical protein NTX92_08155 [Euryarchaeota archaeon]|nr:hypothetical protein [Euryarchaeota archaeon]
MKKNDLKKSLDLLLCCLCIVLFLSPYALGSLSDLRMIVPNIAAAKGESSDLSEMFAQVNESHLQSYVEDIQAFGPHPTGSQALTDLRDYLYSQFSAMNLPVQLDPWTEKKRSG